MGHQGPGCLILSGVRYRNTAMESPIYLRLGSSYIAQPFNCFLDIASLMNTALPKPQGAHLFARLISDYTRNVLNS